MDILETLDLGIIDGYSITAAMVPDESATPDDAVCYDAEDIEAWRKDKWQYVGIVVSASRAGVKLGEDSIWATEYGTLGNGKSVNPLTDNPADSEEWVNGYGPDLILEAIKNAESKLAEINNG